jgi:hypothetical protein
MDNGRLAIRAGLGGASSASVSLAGADIGSERR